MTEHCLCHVLTGFIIRELNQYCLKWMARTMDNSPEWAATLSADARCTLDELKSGLDLHVQISCALNGVGTQPDFDQGERE
jgi:hypothetical protein